MEDIFSWFPREGDEKLEIAPRDRQWLAVRQKLGSG